MQKRDVILRLANRKLFKTQVVREGNYSYRAILEDSGEKVSFANIVFEKYWCTFEDRCVYIDSNPDITEVDEDEEKLVCSGCGQAIRYNYPSSTQQITLRSWLSHTTTCKDLQRKYASQYERNSYKRVEKVVLKPGKYPAKGYRVSLTRSLSNCLSKDGIPTSSMIYADNAAWDQRQASKSASGSKGSKPRVTGSPMSESPSSSTRSSSPEQPVLASRKRRRIELEDHFTRMSEQPAPKRRLVHVSNREESSSWIFRPLGIISKGIANFVDVISDLE